MNNNIIYNGILDSSATVSREEARRVVAEIKADRTYKGKIIQLDDEENPTEYLVDLGQIQIQAIPEDPKNKYALKSTVYVKVLENNFENDRLITGTVRDYSAEHERASNNRFADMVIGRAIEIDSSLNKEISNFKYNPNYDYLGIKVYLNNSEETYNSFKIKVNFYGDELLYSEYLFTNEDILGSPLKLNKNISNSKLWIYPKDKDDIELLNCMSIKNITLALEGDSTITIDKAILYFGYKKSNIEENILRLYANSLEYSVLDDITENIYMEYYNKEKNTNYTIYDSELTFQNNIRLLKYSPGYQKPENSYYEENHWKDINSKIEESYYTLLDESENSSYIKYKAILKPDKDNIVYSQILNFTNATAAAASSVNNDILRLELNDGGCNGVYNFYGLDGNISDKFNQLQERSLSVFFVSDNSPVEIGKNEVEDIEWSYPISNTGLAISYIDNNGQETYLRDNAKRDSHKKPITINQDNNGKFSNTFKFFLNNKYYNSYTNNTITCKVKIKNKEKLEIISYDFTFGTAETNGSSYSLNLDFANPKQRYVKPGETGIELIASFSRLDGAALGEMPQYKWSWYELPYYQDKVYLNEIKYYSSENNELYTIKDNNLINASSRTGTEPDYVYTEYTDSNIFINIPKKIIEEKYYAIAKVTVEYNLDNENNIKMDAYLPIPICLKEIDNYQLSGPDRVVYNMNNEITYDKTPYNLYQEIDYDYTTLHKENNLSWGISSQGTTVCLRNKSCSLNNLTHSLYKNYNNEVQLIPLSAILLNETPPAMSVLAYQNNELVFIQPIVTLRSSWNYNVVNTWAGGENELGENYILTPFLAAGSKNSDNTFTGVMLGQLDTTHGIYGYKNGQLRFKLDENGEFYAGNGKGYIKFDENSFNLKTEDIIIETDNFILNSKDSKLQIGKWRYSDKFMDYYVPSTGAIIGINPDAISGIGNGNAIAVGKITSGLTEDQLDSISWKNCNFRVDGNGNLYTGNATITGILQAGSVTNNIGTSTKPAFSVNSEGIVTTYYPIEFGNAALSSALGSIFRIGIIQGGSPPTFSIQYQFGNTESTWRDVFWITKNDEGTWYTNTATA